MNQSIASLIRNKVFKARKNLDIEGNSNTQSLPNLEKLSLSAEKPLPNEEEDDDDEDDDDDNDSPAEAIKIKKKNSKMMRIRNRMTSPELGFKNSKKHNEGELNEQEGQSYNRKVSSFFSKRRAISTSPSLGRPERFSHMEDDPLIQGTAYVESFPTVSRTPTASSVGSSARLFLNSSKRNTVASSSSLRFNLNMERHSDSFTDTTVDSRAQSSDHFTQIRTSDSLQDTGRRSTRQRSKTIDVADVRYRKHISNSEMILENSRPDNKSSVNDIIFQSRPKSSVTPTTFLPNKSYDSLKTSRVSTGSPHHDNSSTTLSNNKRSASIVNALSSLVSLRSTSRQLSTSKAAVVLGDLPEPPEPLESEGYNSYLERLSPYGKFIGFVLCARDNPFKLNCLRHFIRENFDVRNDSLDIALRKLLIFFELPKESQQIDRLLIEYSRNYYDSQSREHSDLNPWENENQVYFILYSLLVLHTDFYNPNNKNKMTKQEFVNLVSTDTYSNGNKFPIEILNYYYDNIISIESPKFEILSSENEIYSPKKLIREKKVLNNEMKFFEPINFTTNRPSSNSFSSFLQHSSLLTLSDDIDVYSNILNDTLENVSLHEQVERLIQFGLKEQITKGKPKYKKYYNILKEFKGAYLRIPKDFISKFSNLGSFEIASKSVNEDNEFIYAKIIQMGELCVFNKKSALNQFTNKNKYALLTTFGMLIYDSKRRTNDEFFTPELVKNDIVGESYYLIEIKPGFDFVPLDHLFAESNENEQDETNSETELAIWYNGNRIIWRCANTYEKNNWIDSINLLRCIYGCEFNFDCLSDTIIFKRDDTIANKLKTIGKQRLKEYKKLRRMKKVLILYGQCVPISLKTRNELIIQIKQQAVKINEIRNKIDKLSNDINIIDQIT
ncbi:hypothetical protein KAFR_0H00690 [Kazachstania africana CBS 2517]|uniref:SEC7 domain-containing protein n=1 Tax=Kazachstania africana (strain ATCC 22294 / BCRC 22015 / CBS 2517 / CECT 1963 / NBRC 1671 / NRRL Y-8276) TaxID=1071382 RepID=H2AYS2_KAZAF|nr:hypothetical protein KAFR_0H00690 [Kazachstania africana CBS 2517]CCF59478.1 hypothetical protein KAFR_0H00690 [Kazachstania africana CBS 2517]